MLALKIISTVFLSLSFITMVIINSAVFTDEYTKRGGQLTLLWCIYGILWRSLVITTLWLI